MKFTQHVVVHVSDEQKFLDLMQEAVTEDAASAPGALGAKVLRFRDTPGKYVIQADFESWEAAEANNERPETQEWARRMTEVVDGEPKFENLDVVEEFTF